MPSARIRLDVDPTTKKRTVVISYESDEDALPHEHEEAHRALVDKLIERGIVGAGDSIVVEREGEKSVERDKSEEAPQREGVKRQS